GQTPTQVPIGCGELKMLQQAQHWVRACLGRHEITIESNPSSNLLVADFNDLSEHPLFRLQQIEGATTTAGPRVLVSINDDDPVSSATRPSDESAYVYFALLRFGIPSQDALDHVDRLRRNGWRSRFTLQASATPAILDELLVRLRGQPDDETRHRR